MLWQSFTVEVVLKVISVGTPAIRHIHVKIFSSLDISQTYKACPSESGTEVGAPLFPAVEICDFPGIWQCVRRNLVYTRQRQCVVDWSRSEITVNDRAMDSSKQAQRAVIQFLSAEGVSGTGIYSRMKNVYGTECMSRTAVFRWCSDFRHGRVSTADMPRPGQAHVFPHANQDFLRWRYPSSRGPMGHLFQPTRILCVDSRQLHIYCLCTTLQFKIYTCI